MNVNSLLEGASPYANQQTEAAKLASKWEKSGLLEGLNGHEAEKTNMAVLLENQARQLVKEASTLGTAASISTGESEAYAGVALPLVRRVFGEIVAKDLVSVQPMNLPSGLIFYLDFQYGTAQAGFSTAAGQNSLYGANDVKTKTLLPDSNAGTNAQGLYNNRFGYSLNDATLNATAPNTASATLGGILNFDRNFSASLSARGATFGTSGPGSTSHVYVIQIPSSEFTDNDGDLEGVRAFDLSTAGGTIHEVYQQFTRVEGSNVEFLVSGAGMPAGGDVTASFQ